MLLRGLSRTFWRTPEPQDLGYSQMRTEMVIPNLGGMSACNGDVDTLPSPQSGVLPSPQAPTDLGNESVTYDEVAGWFMEADDEDVILLLTTVAASRMHLLQEVLALVSFTDPITEDTEVSPDDLASDSEDLLLPEPSPALPCSQVIPIVQFSTSTYYCDEDDDEVVLDVLRIGGDERNFRSEINYETRDVSAVAGVTFVATSGRLVFEPFENECQIKVPIINNAKWDTTLEFTVNLLEESTVLSEVGKYGSEAQVKVIDNGYFPTPAFAEAIKTGRVHQTNRMSLLIEYFKLNLENSTVMFRTIMWLVIETYHNFTMFLSLFVNVYLVDYVLRHRSSPHHLASFYQDKEGALFLIVLAKILPFALSHLLDHVKVSHFGVAGTSRQTLQVGLVRKYMNYDQYGHANVKAGEIMEALTRDAASLAMLGYENALKVVSELNSLCFMLLYQCIAPQMFGKPTSFLATGVLFMFPVLMLLFFLLRHKMTDDILFVKQTAHTQLVDKVEETVLNYPLISAYGKRGCFASRFEERVLAYNQAATRASTALNNNVYFSHWTLTIVVAVWTFIGGQQVLAGTLSLGMFLTNVHICNKLGNSWIKIYETLLEIHSVIPALERMVVLMNTRTDFRVRKEIASFRRMQSNTIRSEMREDDSMRCEMQQAFDTWLTKEHVIDRMPIVIGNITFTYNASHKDIVLQPVNLSGLFHIKQGQMVCLIGPKGGGKTTLLKMLAAEILPNLSKLGVLHLGGHASAGGRGCFFIPRHLRTLHVREAMFIVGSIRANLIFGIAHEQDGRPERVRAICKRLCVSDEVLLHLDADNIANWPVVLSSTQLQLLHLARALISNPEVLTLHRPLVIFSPQDAQRVLGAFREFVRNRGLEEEPENISQRRPRTCIMTSARTDAAQGADRIFHVSNRAGIREVDEQMRRRLVVGTMEVSELTDNMGNGTPEKGPTKASPG